jgi:hypothetical protein
VHGLWPPRSWFQLAAAALGAGNHHVLVNSRAAGFIILQNHGRGVTRDTHVLLHRRHIRSQREIDKCWCSRWWPRTDCLLYPLLLLFPSRLLDRERDQNGGKYPETIALVLWGTDNIKTYGESLAQVGAAYFLCWPSWQVAAPLPLTCILITQATVTHRLSSAAHT